MKYLFPVFALLLTSCIHSKDEGKPTSTQNESLLEQWYGPGLLEEETECTPASPETKEADPATLLQTEVKKPLPENTETAPLLPDSSETVVVDEENSLPETP